MTLSVLRIAKAKIKDGQLHIELDGAEADTERHTALRSLGGYSPDPQAAFDACIPHVRKILDWPTDQYAGGLQVTGVNWKHGDSAPEGAILVCKATLGNKRVFCFNTSFVFVGFVFPLCTT